MYVYVRMWEAFVAPSSVQERTQMCVYLEKRSTQPPRCGKGMDVCAWMWKAFVDPSTERVGTYLCVYVEKRSRLGDPCVCLKMGNVRGYPYRGGREYISDVEKRSPRPLALGGGRMCLGKRSWIPLRSGCFCGCRKAFVASAPGGKKTHVCMWKSVPSPSAVVSGCMCLRGRGKRSSIPLRSGITQLC